MEEQSVISFCNQLVSKGEAVSCLKDLSDGRVFLWLLSLVDQMHLTPGNTSFQPETWQQRLTNLKLLLGKMKEYTSRHFLTTTSKQEVELLGIAKDGNEQQIMELFDRVFEILINCDNHRFFIEKITLLSLEEQGVFQHKVMEYMRQGGERSPINSPKGKHSNTLLSKFGELEDELRAANEENGVLERTSQDLRRELQNYKLENQKLREAVDVAEAHMLEGREREEMSFAKNIQHSQQLVQSLEDKLTDQNIQYEKRLLRLQEENSLLQNRIFKAESNEEKLQEARDKIRDLTQKVVLLNNQKEELQDKVLSHQDAIKALEGRVKSQNEELNSMEMQKITLRADFAKSNARSSELQKMLSTSIQQRKSKPNLIETLSQVQDSFEIKYQEAKESFHISNRRVKELQKQLARTNLRAQKLDKVEAEKMKLEDMLVQFTNFRGQEVEMLVSALYELRCRYEALGKRQFMEESTLAQIECD